MVLAAITGGKTVLNLSKPSIPTPEEAVEYGRAKAKVLDYLPPAEDERGRVVGISGPMAEV
jgi:hypothetical protein